MSKKNKEIDNSQDERDEEVDRLMDEYFNKFGAGYIIPIFSDYNWADIKKDVKKRIEENNPQEWWNPDNKYSV